MTPPRRLLSLCFADYIGTQHILSPTTIHHIHSRKSTTQQKVMFDTQCPNYVYDVFNPYLSSPTSSSNQSSYEVSMDDQERKKLERKRARNRQAASKCRQKKMDKIQELEQVVNNEKSRGQNLDAELQRLHGTLQQLQRLMERHAARGSCPSHMSS